MDIEEIKAKVRANEYVYTVYIPHPPRFVDPWTRGEETGEESAV